MKPLARFRNHIFASALAIAGLTFSTSLMQAQTLVNGGFEGNTTSSQLRSQGQAFNLPSTNCAFPGGSVTPCLTVNGWTADGLVFVFVGDGTAITTGAKTATAADSTWILSRGMAPNTFNGHSPLGGNFIGLDADRTTTFPTGGGSGASRRIQGSISQEITGLKPGEATTVTFAWAANQAMEFSGPTNENVLVSLCPAGAGLATASNPRNGCGTPLPPPPGRSAGLNQPFTGGTGVLAAPAGTQQGNFATTNTVAIPTHGFSGWMNESVTFDPTSSSEVLSFLAQGNPNGDPPFVLLDGVTLEQHNGEEIPEPGTWLMIGIGLAAMAGFVYRHPEWLRVSA